MKLPEMTDDTLLRWAMEEDNLPVSVGSLDGVFQRKGAPAAAPVPVAKFAFGALINLQRRRNQWTVEDLANRAQIGLDEAVSIEEDPSYRPEPRSVYQLAKILTLPIQRLLVLSGNAELQNSSLERAAVIFAARSRAVEKLTDAESQALNEFVSALADEDERKVL